jgi:KipI family sensor histidine kinase inhibitor
VTPEALGDGAWRWPRPPDVDARALLETLRRHPGVLDVVLTEAHVAVYFDPTAPPVRPWEARPAPVEAGAPRRHRIRVRYDGEDLAFVARAAGLAEEEVARLHSGATYTVAMLGFLPGFAYLRGLPAALVVPRRAQPRPRVPAGAVAIAAQYTGIYPFASPGGWHLLGTSLDFSPFSAERGALWALGDEVRFERAP